MTHGEVGLVEWAELQTGREVSSVALHPRSGRNRLTVLTMSDGGKLIVKEGHTPAEARIFETTPAAARPPLAVDGENRRLLFDLAADSRTLEEVTFSSETWAKLLHPLAMLLAETHAQHSDDLPPLQHPWPMFQPISWQDFQTLTPAARQLVRQIQQRPLLANAADTLRGLSGNNLVHGDIKADNIVVSEGKAQLIDWELSGSGHPLVDVGALIGMVLSKWAENVTLGNEPEVGLTAKQLVALLSPILSGYAEKGENLTLQDAALAGAGWLVSRAWTGAMHERYLTPVRSIELVLAHRIIRVVGQG